MSAAQRAGRLVGAMLLAQMVTEFVLNQLLLTPVLRAPGGFLANAAASAWQLRVAVLLGLASAGLALGIAITAWPLFRARSERVALGFLVLAAAGLPMLVAENVALLGMLSLSQEHARAVAAAEPVAAIEAVATVARSARNWAPFTRLVVTGSSILLLYAVLWRGALVPRALGAFGMVAALSQIAAVGMPLVGRPVAFALLAPVALSHLALSLWLLVRGFAERPQARGPLTAPRAPEVSAA